MATQNLTQRPSLNWQLCAELHNRILEIGWEVVSEETGWEPDADSWWEHYFGAEGESDSDSVPDDGEKIEQDEGEDDPEKDDKSPELVQQLLKRLHPDLVKFLQNAKHDYPGTRDSSNFIYYLQVLMTPRQMTLVLDNDPVGGFFKIQPQPDQFVCLYSIPRSYGEGLM